MAKPLTDQQQQLIQALLLRTRRISEAAAQIGVDPQIARNWMQKPFMQTAFEQARRELVNKLIANAQAKKELVEAIKTDEAMQRAARTIKKSDVLVEWGNGVIPHYATYEDTFLFTKMKAQLDKLDSVTAEMKEKVALADSMARDMQDRIEQYISTLQEHLTIPIEHYLE